jgi:hypothetical protein
MDVMAKPQAEMTRPVGPDDGGRKLKRLHFELMLELADANRRPFADIVRRAAESAGGDLLFALPAADGGQIAIVRLSEDGSDCFLQVRSAEIGFAITQDGEIDTDLLGFARAAVDVLERLRADQKILEPLGAATH